MGKLTNLNPPAPITDSDIPAAITRDDELTAAINALTTRGLWTPVLSYDSPGTSVISFGRNTGRFEKRGNRVLITFDIRVSSFSKGSASGYLVVKGLPYPIRQGLGYDNNYGNLVILFSSFTGIPHIDTATGLISSRSAFALISNQSNGAHQSLADPTNNSMYFGQLDYETT